MVADLGNTRLKWGRLDPSGNIVASVALPLDDVAAWEAAWSDWNPAQAPSTWAIASVNPPIAERLEAFLARMAVTDVAWYRSVADVPVRHAVEEVHTGGADRALAVLEAAASHPAGGPGLVVLCGTAITVETIDAQGVWQGGAIAPGMQLAARALHMLTAQLPLIVPRASPPPSGRSTQPSLEAGLFWGSVGTIRELLTRQAGNNAPPPWLVWSGGDAPALAPEITWPQSCIVPNLVLQGVARVAFPATSVNRPT